MNFNPVGRKPNGELYMKFHEPFTIIERIQLLQRSILVNSFAYYELDTNLLSDFQYDANARQLAELREKYPDEFNRSRYFEYFKDFCSDEDGTVNTSGFDLIERVRRSDKDLYRRINMDTCWAIDLKREKGVVE